MLNLIAHNYCSSACYSVNLDFMYIFLRNCAVTVMASVVTQNFCE